MKYLFSKSGLKILESFCFTPTLFAFDYDGTLAKIVKDPANALMTPTTHGYLLELQKLAPLSILSGRSLKDLQTLLPFRPNYLIGNHGLEGLKKNGGNLQAALKISQKWKSSLQSKIESNPGVFLEDKGYSLAIHYRKSRKKVLAKERILQSCSELEPVPRLILGKCVVNLLPTGAPHKGIALLELMRECGLRNALYIGDDDTDEDVFSLPETRLLSVRVGKKNRSAAHFYISGQNEINRFLKTIIKYLRE